MIDSVDSVAQELGRLFKFNVHRTPNNQYAFNTNGLTIFVLSGDSTDAVYLVTALCKVVGNFQEQVFAEVLKRNGMPPYDMIFGFNPQNEELILSKRLELDSLESTLLHSAFENLVNKGKLWKETIEKGIFPHNF